LKHRGPRETTAPPAESGRSRKARTPERPTFSLEPFEPRILLSADPLGVVQADLLLHKPLVAERGQLDNDAPAPQAPAAVESLGGFDTVIDDSVFAPKPGAAELHQEAKGATARGGERAASSDATASDWVVLDDAVSVEHAAAGTVMAPSESASAGTIAAAPAASDPEISSTKDSSEVSRNSGRTAAQRILLLPTRVEAREASSTHFAATDSLRPNEIANDSPARAPPVADATARTVSTTPSRARAADFGPQKARSPAAPS